MASSQLVIRNCCHIAFQQAALGTLNAIGFAEPGLSSWPQLLAGSLWGGAWGALLTPVLIRAGDVLLWPVALLAGALAPTLASFLVDAAYAGDPVAASSNNTRILTLLSINAAWGLGTALLLQFVRTATAIVLLTRGMP